MHSNQKPKTLKGYRTRSQGRPQVADQCRSAVKSNAPPPPPKAQQRALSSKQRALESSEHGLGLGFGFSGFGFEYKIRASFNPKIAAHLRQQRPVA